MEQELIRFDSNNIVVFNEFEGQLAELEKDAARTKHDYDDPQGLIDAKADVKKATTSITAIEKIRKSEKKESLDYGRALDKKAKDITARLETVREINAGPIREIKELEEARLRCHTDNINAFFAFREFGEWSAQDYQAELDLIEKIPLDDSWEEFRAKAAIAKDQAVTQLKEKVASCKQLEQEQAELVRLREESAARDKADQEAKVVAEAEERVRKEAAEHAEQVRQENLLAARNAAADMERKENERQLELERARRDIAEAQERAANAEKEATEKVAREQRERAEQEQAEAKAREADVAHQKVVNNLAMQGFTKLGFSQEESMRVVTAIAKFQIKNVTISY